MLFDFEPFSSRHIGPDAEETAAMLKAVGASSLDALIDEAIPSRIRLKTPLNLPDGHCSPRSATAGLEPELVQPSSYLGVSDTLRRQFQNLAVSVAGKPGFTGRGL